MKVPKCMSTQHPDNVNMPFFSQGEVFSGDGEVKEAYYFYSHMNGSEQMWDSEGKDVVNSVVSKLLTNYSNYFRENELGRDVYLTLRVPNPSVEKTEGKILFETLESIPRSYDVAKVFYKKDQSPIFEVILPMTTSSEELTRVHNIYKELIVGKENIVLNGDDNRIGDWVGEFMPKEISVIPLYEDLERLLNCDKISREYIEGKGLEYQRVFLARSDPALNYGLTSAVLLNKLALQKLDDLTDELSVELYPIIGVGSAPFRGNLKPSNVENVLKEYPSVHTYTIQSAFKYDNSINSVRKGISKIKNSETGNAQVLNESELRKVISDYSKEYGKQVIKLSNVINRVANHVPKRRKRKLHIGLYGYSRSVNGIALPRAIKFTASLYSIGLPPELLGLNALKGKSLEKVLNAYKFFEHDLKDSLRFFNCDNPFTPEGVEDFVDEFITDYEINHEHAGLTNKIINSLTREEAGLESNIIEAANIRGFLG